MCVLVHLVINKRAPVYLQNLLTTTVSVPGRASNRSISNNDFVRQSTRLKLGERAFSVAGPRVWNQLPTDLKTITDTRVFKHKLKSFFFVSIPLAHTDIVGPPVICRWRHRLCIIVLYCNLECSAM